MPNQQREPSGRPDGDEFAVYVAQDIAAVAGDDAAVVPLLLDEVEGHEQRGTTGHASCAWSSRAHHNEMVPSAHRS